MGFGLKRAGGFVVVFESELANEATAVGLTKSMTKTAGAKEAAPDVP
jgi:hypothetical protein